RRPQDLRVVREQLSDCLELRLRMQQVAVGGRPKRYALGSKRRDPRLNVLESIVYPAGIYFSEVLGHFAGIRVDEQNGVLSLRARYCHLEQISIRIRAHARAAQK